MFNEYPIGKFSNYFTENKTHWETSCQDGGTGRRGSPLRTII